jgi:hypothetical protein
MSAVAFGGKLTGSIDASCNPRDMMEHQRIGANMSEYEPIEDMPDWFKQHMAEMDAERKAFGDPDVESEREPVSQDDENYDAKLFYFVQAVIATDDDSYRDIPKLAGMFPGFPPEYRAGINHAFVMLCGWNFDTMIHAFETGQSMQEAAEREKSELDQATEDADFFWKAIKRHQKS